MVKLLLIFGSFLILLPTYATQFSPNNDITSRDYITGVFPKSVNSIKKQQLLTEAVTKMKANDVRNMYDAVPLVLQRFETWFKDHTEKTQCVYDIYDFLVGMKDMEPWAMEMFDAYGKFSSGMMQGNLAWAGNYGECLDITAAPVVNDTYVRTFENQYCWALFGVSPPEDSGIWQLNAIANVTEMYPIRSAICVPDSCSEEEMNLMMDHLMEFIPINKFLTFRGVSCIPKNVSLWDNKGAVTAFLVCCTIATLLVMGTLYDLYKRFHRNSPFMYSKLPNSEPVLAEQNNDLIETEIVPNDKLGNSIITSSISVPQKNGAKGVSVVKKRQGILGQLMLSFSVYTNASKILNLSTSKDNIPVINGIRFISMTWVILGHTFLMGFNMYYDNPALLMDVIKTFTFHIIANGHLAPDTFFVLGGLLTAYSILTIYEKSNGKVSWIILYIHRYWRLTPPYILFIYLIDMKLSRYFSNGPFWPDNSFSGGCEKHWWYNVLYINNFLTVTEMCMGWTWYMANDMQFFWLSPIILIPLAKRKLLLGFSIAGALILGSIVCLGVMLSHYGLHIFIDVTEVDIDIPKYINLFDQAYTKPYTRMAPYIIGIICGWFIYEFKTKGYKLKKQWIVTGWLTSISLALTVILSAYHAQMSQPVETLYHSLTKVAWPLSVAWVIFACVNDAGGVVTNILTWPVWNPLSRLTYMAYIWHYLALLSFFGSLERPLAFSYTIAFFFYIAMAFMSYAGAFIFSLALEAPFLAMEKIIFPW